MNARHLFQLLLLLLLGLCTSARAQLEELWVSDMGGEDTVTVQVGEILELRVNIRTYTTAISGFQCFLSFADHIARPIRYNDTPNGWFNNLNLFSGNVIFADDHDSRSGMTPLPGHQLDWCFQTGVGTPRPVFTANGASCTFKVQFLQPLENYEIRFDHDNNQFRNTLFWAGSSAEERPFYREYPMVVNVVGVGFGPLPDMYLSTPAPRDSIDLFEYLEEFEGFDPDSVHFSWNALGENNVCVTDSLRDGERFWMIFDTAGPGRRIEYRVQAHAMGLLPVDTLTVFRGDAPVIDDDLAEQDPYLYWLEDQRDSLWLDNHVTDLDDDVSTLVWSRIDQEREISVEFTEGRMARFISSPDWSGIDTLYLRVEDPGGLSDTSRVICHVAPVNDGPLLDTLPQIEVHTGLAEVINLDHITTDVDHLYEDLVWTISGDTSLVAARVDLLARTLTFEVQPGTPLWSQVSFQLRVEDPPGLWDEKPLQVLVSSYPPIWNLPAERVMLSGGTLVLALNDFVEDQDNPDSELQLWFTGAERLDVSVDPVTHVAVIQGPVGWTGVEDLVAWARDTDNNTNTDTLRVVVVLGGRPLVALVPDMIFLPGQQDSLELDRHVWDTDTPDDLMSWSIELQPGTLFSHVLDPATRTVVYTAPMMPGIVEQAVYRATDDQGNQGEDIGSLAVIDPSGRPLMLPFAEIWMPAGSMDSSIVLDDFVYDYDHDKDELSWSIGAGAYSSGQIRPGDRRLFINSGNLPGTDQLALTVTDPDQQSSNGVLVVHVHEGNAPIVSAFAPRYVIAGQDDTLRTLSHWVYDADPGEQISWTFIPEEGSPLQVNLYQTLDMAIIRTTPEHVGVDEILAIATDEAQNSDSGLIELHSLENRPPLLELGLLPNPAESRLIDFVILSNEALRSVSARLASDSSTVPLQTLLVAGSNLPVWRARLGSLGIAGETSETIRVTARDLPGYPQVAGNLAVDSLSFSTALLGAGSSITSPDGRLQLVLAAERGAGRWIIEERWPDDAEWTVRGSAAGRLHLTTGRDLEIDRGAGWARFHGGEAVETGDRLRPAGSDSVPLPMGFTLGTPSPNPFNPIVQLPFSLDATAEIRLEIVDMLGRRIRVLQQGRLEAGYHVATWNGLDEQGLAAASGMYLARLRQGERQSVAKLMLLK